MFAKEDAEIVYGGAAIRGGVPPTGLMLPSMMVWWGEQGWG
jgi:hypothetical protein